ncbi:MAG: hypothetical protein WCO57_08040, partial [Verrucomicrobiota bacterium]
HSERTQHAILHFFQIPQGIPDSHGVHGSGDKDRLLDLFRLAGARPFHPPDRATWRSGFLGRFHRLTIDFFANPVPILNSFKMRILRVDAGDYCVIVTRFGAKYANPQRHFAALRG